MCLELISVKVNYEPTDCCCFHDEVVYVGVAVGVVFDILRFECL